MAPLRSTYHLLISPHGCDDGPHSCRAAMALPLRRGFPGPQRLLRRRRERRRRSGRRGQRPQGGAGVEGAVVATGFL